MRLASLCVSNKVILIASIETRREVFVLPFQTDFMTTGISPLGLISFSRLPDAISQVVKTSVDNVPVNQMDAYRRNDAKEVASVFSEAISNAIITQLKSLETRDLQ